MRPYERVYASIDLNAVISNIQAMKRQLPNETGMIGVVKADGYGHGAVPVALAMEHLVWGYGVATIDEALILRHHGIQKPILVLGVIHKSRFQEAIDQGIRLTIFTLEQAKALEAAAKGQQKTAQIHLALDTGMGRIGMTPDEAGAELALQIAGLSGLAVEGLFTHFARADEWDHSWTMQQLRQYDEFQTRLNTKGLFIPFCHCANSAGIIEVPKSHMDLVRAGISIYGLYPSDQVEQELIPLTPVMGIKSFLTYVKTVEPGMSISYGGTFTAERTMRVATVPVGYGDGYPRNLSGKGYVLIHGQKAPILGRVCMDQFMVDVTSIDGVCTDDPVTLVGIDGTEQIRVEGLAKAGGGFHYEILCDIGKRVPRVYVKDGQIVAKKDYFDDIYHGFGSC